MKKSDLSKYMAGIGSKGGQASGTSKTRSPEHYRKMVAARQTVKAERDALRECCRLALVALNTARLFKVDGVEGIRTSYDIAAFIERELRKQGVTP